MKTQKVHLINATAQASGHSQTESRAVIEEFMGLVKEHLVLGNVVELRTFGTFHARTRKARPGRNVRTGEVVPLPVRRVALFRYSPELVRGISEARGLPLAHAAQYQDKAEKQGHAAHARSVRLGMKKWVP